VLKAVHRRVGRSARAGIALDLADDHAVREAFAVISGALGPDAGALVVQQMVPPGVDVHIRCVADPLLGPVVTLDLGSLQAKDPDGGASRLVPLSRVTAEAMVESSRVGGALRRAGLEPSALIDTIVRVAQLMADHPALSQIDIDPALVSADGCVPTDARITVQPEPPSAFPIRRLG
jgi:hypothetical protein